MPLRLMSALCILLLAGCASSEPQSASYAPVADASPILPSTPQAGGSPVSYDQMDAVSPGDMSAAPALQPGCSTVDGVTLCDAPYDPAADDTLYTN